MERARSPEAEKGTHSQLLIETCRERRNVVCETVYFGPCDSHGVQRDLIDLQAEAGVFPRYREERPASAFREIKKRFNVEITFS